MPERILLILIIQEKKSEFLQDPYWICHGSSIEISKVFPQIKRVLQNHLARSFSKKIIDLKTGLVENVEKENAEKENVEKNTEKENVEK